jgi:hypothetical protein
MLVGQTIKIRYSRLMHYKLYEVVIAKWIYRISLPVERQTLSQLGRFICATGLSASPSGVKLVDNLRSHRYF